MATYQDNLKEKFDAWKQQGKDLINTDNNGSIDDRRRDALEEWLDLGISSFTGQLGKFGSIFDSFFDPFKNFFLQQYDASRGERDRLNELTGMLDDVENNLLLEDNIDPINPDVNSLWHAFKNWVMPRRDPLVLDLDGDGIETLGVNATTHVVFDYDGDGVKTGTGWIKGDDGFVVLDRNGNGTIDNGGELFGDQTLVNGVKAADGFAALSAQDTNANGKFDAGDTNFTNVRIWQDTNSDGISQAGELHTLNELGITSINLTSTTSNTVSNGNVQIAKGTFTKTNGTTGESGTLNLTEDTGNAGNLNFSQNPFYSEFTDHLTLTDTAKTLPDMQGSGMVRDLQEASTLSSGLTSTLQSMSTTYETRDQMMAQIDTLLAQWAGTSSMETGRMKANKMGGDLVYLESVDMDLYHKYLWANQHNNYSLMTTEEITAAQAIIEKQNYLGDMIDALERFNSEVFSGIVMSFEALYESGQLVQVNTLMGLLGHPNTAEWSFTAPMEIILSTAQVSFLEQSYAALEQSVYDSLVLQTRLSGYMDVLKLTIDETGIHIDDSVMMGMLTTLLQTNPENAFVDLFEIKKYAGASFNLLGWNGDERILDMLAASDGIYDATALFTGYGMSIADGTYTGTTGNDDVWGKQRDDVINAEAGDNRVHGGAGNDSITTGNSWDTLYGDVGDDFLYSGQYGADALSGGAGNDILEGGCDNDTYLFSKGDGKDIIYDGYNRQGTANSGVNAGSRDAISFGAGISVGDVVAKAVGNNLVLAIRESGKTFDQLTDTITIENWYDTNNRIEYIVFEDGTVLNTVAAILSLAGTEWDDTIIGIEQGMTLDAKGGNDIVTSLNGNNIINGGAGNDSITTGGGADILDGGIGIDTLKGGTGNDTYIIDTTTDILIENANEGIDTVQSSISYTLKTNFENLTLTGTSAINGYGNTLNNTLTGNSANNTLNGSAGADTMLGGDGSDLYYVDNTGDQVIETLTGGTGDTIISTINWTLGDNIEVLRLLGSGAINGTGNTLSNTLYSGDGDNVLDGGAGNDNLSYGYATSGVTVNLGITTSQNTLGSGIDTILNIENLIGSTFNDNFIGNIGNNILVGSKGNDTLNGGTGNDTYTFNVGDGIDSIFDHDMNGSTNGGTDRVAFSTGITGSSVAFYMNGNDLVISYGGTDTVTVKNQSIAENTIEKVSLSDGNYLTSNDINTIIQSMNSYASSHDIAITSIDSVKANQDLMNIVAAGWHK